MRELRLAPDLRLSVEVAGEAIAILAKRGAGKTNTATVLVEELHAAGVQVVILDPVGAWWGIRSSATGGEGLPVPILGGQHGDVPLEPAAGALIADVAVDSGESLLLDLSDFPSKAAVARFVTDFGERLYRRKARSSSLLHLVLEEADEFAPQKTRVDEARMQAVVEQLVRRGRSRGIGVTMVTQRSAVLNKDVLEQADVLIAMRTTGPNDRKAIERWIDRHADRDVAEQVLDSLPMLATGEAWIWNPERGLLERVRIRRRKTFDSSATPAAGKKRVEPKRVAAIDLEKLGAEIQATAERAAASDPRQLQARIRELERELTKRPTEVETMVETVVERLEVPVLSDGQVERLANVVGELRDVAKALGEFAGEISNELARVGPGAPNGIGRGALAARARSSSAPRPAPCTPVPQGDTKPAPDSELVDGLRLGRADGALLAVLAQFPEGRSRHQLAVLSGYSAKSSTFRNALGRLRTLGLASSGSVVPIRATEAGLEAARDVDPLPTGRALYEHWRAQLPQAGRALLEALYEAWPDGLPRVELAERSGYSIDSSTFRNALGRLRTFELATPANVEPIRVADELFEERR